MGEEGQPEQPAGDTEQEYHVEEPAQSPEEVEAPAEPPQKAPKGCGATKKTTKSAAAQVSHAVCCIPSVHRDISHYDWKCAHDHLSYQVICLAF